MNDLKSNRQAEQYDRIISDYDQHYYDEQSLSYRRRFILDPMVSGLDLNGMRVADLASGSGHTSLYLKQRFPDVAVEGFDISPEAVRRYEALTHAPGHVLDLTKPVQEAQRFDAAVIMGGLHHCVVDLPTTLANVTRMLVPGGKLMMFEPNADYILEFARKLWYRADHYFDDKTERALSHRELLSLGSGDFACDKVKYFGGPAFFLVYNSLVFRLPRRAKQIMSPPLMALERAYDCLPGSWPFASFIARWTKISGRTHQASNR